MELAFLKARLGIAKSDEGVPEFKPPAPQREKIHEPAVRQPAPVIADPRGGLEESVVGTWFPRVGAVAILIGAGFAFKYAIDLGIIGPGARVALGILAGVAFLIYGWWTESRGWKRYAQAVTAGGIALLYLSILAAFHLYSLIPGTAAFFFLIFVSLLNAGLAFHYDAQPLAVLAVFGAFINPFLISPDPGDPQRLYIYIALVDLGVIALGSIKKWHALEFEALAGTWLTFAVGVQSAEISLALEFSTIFFLLFHSIPFLRTYLSGRNVDELDLWILVPNALIYLGAGLYVLDPVQKWQGPFVLILAIVHLVTAVLLDKDQRLLKTSHFGLSILFFTAWIPIQFDGFLVATGWAMKGLLIVVMGRRLASSKAIKTGMAILGLGFLGAISMLTNSFDPDRPFFNLEAANVLAVIVCISGASASLSRSSDHDERRAAIFGAIAANVLALSWLTAEITDYFGGQVFERRQAFHFALSATWALYAATLLVVGVARRIKWARLFAAGLLGLTILKMAFVDLWTLETGYRVLAFTGLGAVLLLTSLMYHRFKEFLFGEEEVAVSSE